MNKMSDSAKVRAISYILCLFLVPMFAISLGFVLGIFMFLENGFSHPPRFAEILFWINSLILCSLGAIGLKGLFAKKLYGKWMAFVFSLLFWVFFIGRGLPIKTSMINTGGRSVPIDVIIDGVHIRLN